MIAWNKRNPAPKMREIKAKNGTAEYEGWLKKLIEAEKQAEQERLLGLDPNADLKAAIREHEVAKTAWGDRKRIAEANCGYQEAEARWEDAIHENGFLV